MEQDHPFVIGDSSALGRIDQLRQLSEGLRVSTEALLALNTILLTMKDLGLAIPALHPDYDGGVNLTWPGLTFNLEKWGIHIEVISTTECFTFQGTIALVAALKKYVTDDIKFALSKNFVGSST